MHEPTTDPKPSSVIAPNTEFELEFSWAEVQPAYEQAIQKLSRGVKLKGFRQGKVPAKLAVDAIGPDKIIQTTLEKIIPPAYQKWLEKENKRPLTHPDVEPLKAAAGEKWQVKVAFAEAPVIKLGKYQELVKKGLKEAEKEITELEKDPKLPKPPTDEDKKELKLRKIFAQLVEGIKPAIPDLLVRDETRKELDQLLKSLDQLKLSFDEYLQRRQATFEQLTNELASTAIARLQLEFIMLAISDEEKIQPTEAEITEQINQITNLELRKEYQKNHHYQHYVAGILTRQKTVEHLLHIH